MRVSFLCFLHIFIFSSLFQWCIAVDEEQRMALRKAVGVMLNFESPLTRGNASSKVSRTSEAAAKYMRKLFERYTRKESHLGLEGNIVRSFTPLASAVADQDALLFRLNSLKQNERIVRAELHFNHRHKISPSKWNNRRLMDVRASCASCLPKTLMLPIQRIPSDSKHWLSFDLRDLVDDAMKANVTKLHVQFLRKGRAFNAERLIRTHSPFLLVFSESDGIISKSIFGEREESPNAHVHSTQKAFTERTKRSVSSADYYTYALNKNGNVKTLDANLDSEMEIDSRQSEEYKKRLHLEEFRKNGPRMLHSRRQKSHRRRQRYDPDDPWMGFGKEPEDDVQQPTVHNKARKQRKSEPATSNDLTVFLLGGDNKRVEQKCAKHGFIVDFRDIGWEEWIIAPKSFDAQYCSGSCPYPLEPEVNPSNHAILQSVIHSVGLNPYVPSVCCAPDKMDSLTLLYYDEMDNVVLKNFPQMTVTSCGCI